MKSRTRSSNRATSDSCPVGPSGPIDPGLLLKSTVSTGELAEAFGLPIVHSAVNGASGQSKPTRHALGDLLEDNPRIDRTTIKAWEAPEFPAGERATRRRKLILCALWTEV